METSPSLPPLPIIVVEDDPIDLYLLHRVLAAHELAHELHVIGTADDVLDAVHRLAQQEHRRSPILLLLDLRLPQRNGKEILHQVKALPQGAEVRVVIVTGSHNPADRRETLALGADAYFVKPFHFEEFMQLGALIKEAAWGHPAREPSRPWPAGGHTPLRDTRLLLALECYDLWAYPRALHLSPAPTIRKELHGSHHTREHGQHAGVLCRALAAYQPSRGPAACGRDLLAGACCCLLLPSGLRY